MTDADKKQHLRKQLRTARVQASSKFSEQATKSINKQLSQLRIYKSAKNIAVYLPFKSEFPTQAIIQSNLRMAKRTYVPKITSTRNSKMRFIELDSQIAQRFITNDNNRKSLAKNTLGIEEPEYSNTSIRPQSLDVIFMPLLGFDSNGNRLGMGGGYYDRALSFKRSLNHIRKPYLIGLAYEAQHIKNLQTEPWDVSLDAVLTEERLYSISPRV